jgi:hypothetical protein
MEPEDFLPPGRLYCEQVECSSHPHILIFKVLFFSHIRLDLPGSHLQVCSSYAFPIALVLATCPVHFIFIGLATPIIW